MASDASRYTLQLFDKIKLKDKTNYTSLISQLLKTEFHPNNVFDKNRIDDIVSLRYSLTKTYMTDELYSTYFPFSWLELLIVLAIKAEEQMATYGEDKTSYWFWLIIDRMFPFAVTNYQFIDNCHTKIAYVLYDIENHRESLIFDKPELAEKEILAQLMEILNEYIAENAKNV